MIIIFMMAMQVHSLWAQRGNEACHYTIDIAGIPAGAFPFRITTAWLCPDDIRTHPTLHVANGIVTYPLNPPAPSPAPPCPQACQMAWGTINGIYVPTPLGESRNYRTDRGCYGLSVMTDTDGTIRITIRPCGTSEEPGG